MERLADRGKHGEARVLDLVRARVGVALGVGVGVEGRG